MTVSFTSFYPEFVQTPTKISFVFSVTFVFVAPFEFIDGVSLSGQIKVIPDQVKEILLYYTTETATIFT